MSKYCFIYFGLFSIKFVYGNLKNRKLTIINPGNKSVIDKLRFKFMSSCEFILEDFQFDSTKFYTNISEQTNRNGYKLLQKKLFNNELYFSKKLSECQLENTFEVFIDRLLGDDILFSDDVFFKKVQTYIKKSTEESISSELIPYLYFINYVNKHDYDWSECFGTMSFRNNFIPCSQSGIPIRRSWSERTRGY